MNKLNFGCGSIQPQGWYNVDKDSAFQQYSPGTPFTLQTTENFSDSFFDIIVAHAVIQQIEWHVLVDQLKELRRILKPGGVLRISLPDILAGFYAYTLQNKKFFPNGEEDLDARFSAWLTWYSTSVTLLTPKALLDKLIEAGFKEAGLAGFNRNWLGLDKTIATSAKYICTEALELDTREHEFFFMEARK